MFVIVTRGDLREEIDMADEAFALSPISARAALPGEEDYAAISEAFMETSRGRWFLAEYAKRNRNADTRMVLDAASTACDVRTTFASNVWPGSSAKSILVAVPGFTFSTSVCGMSISTRNCSSRAML